MNFIANALFSEQIRKLHPAMKVNWTGIYPAVTTKFHADESLDPATFSRNLEAQIDAGVDGIVVGGTLGESSVLTHKEKYSLITTATAVSKGRVPIVMGIAENTTRDAVHFAKECYTAGADGFMLLPPMRYHSDRRETLRFLHTVADATDLPIMLYNNPISYNIMLTIDMLQDLAQNEKFQAIKESCGDVRYMTDIKNALGDRYKILSGVDDLALESLVMGADGWVAGLVCAFPKETVAIYRLVQEGRIAEARAIYRWFAPLLHLDVSTKLVQNIKLAETMVGLGTEHVREPRLPLAGKEREEVVAILEEGIRTRPVL